MKSVLHPWQMLLLILAGWVNKHQQNAIEYLIAENRILREKIGLRTFYLLFVMEIATRRVYFAGCTSNPDEEWMLQVGRNLTDSEEGFLRNKRYLLMDRDKKYNEMSRSILAGAGVKPVRLPLKSPDLNAHIERYIRSLKAECLERLILFGEESLRNAVGSFLMHYHTERNHQGIQNRIIQPAAKMGKSQGEIDCRNRLGGMLRYYYRKAA